MNRTKRLAQHRAILVVECALQRTTLIAQSQHLGRLTGLVSSGHGLINRLKKMPGWMSALLVGMAIIIPVRRALSLAKSGLVLWKMCRSLFAKTTH